MTIECVDVSDSSTCQQLNEVGSITVSDATFSVRNITEIGQLVLSAVEEDRCAVVLSPGFGQALETSQVLQNLGRLHLIPPLVDAGAKTPRESDRRKVKLARMDTPQMICMAPTTQKPPTPTCSKTAAGHSRRYIGTGSGSPGRSRSRRPSHHGSADHSRRRRFSGLCPGAGNTSSQTSWVKQTKCWRAKEVICIKAINSFAYYVCSPSKHRVGGVG